MDFDLTREAFVFLCSCACGAGIFLLYDLFRSIRKSAGGGTALTDLQDCLFWVLAFVVMFFVIFYINNGV
ncbi:MAG: spore cortex biosynthesis protein YabQ, partial [Clostridia bacterium]|nr:spore cortex biosynthesis protein YabQ [Clostridia bacterium]